MGKPTKILHNVAVGVVLNDVLDPLIAVLISATLRFSRMASSGLGNVDLSEVLFALENAGYFVSALLTFPANCAILQHLLFDVDVISVDELECTSV